MLAQNFKCVPSAPESLWQKPIFLKNLSVVWDKLPEYNAQNTMLVDDSRYKCLRNPEHTYVCPEGFDPEDVNQDPKYLTKVMLPWLYRWAQCSLSDMFVHFNPIKNDRDHISQLVIDYSKTIA